MIQELKNYTILNHYIVGSSLYKYKEASDVDYLVVVKEDIESFQILSAKKDYSIYSLKTFKNMIIKHDPLALECLFSPQDYILKQDFIPQLILDKNKLRNSFSQKSSNSWVKARKKMTVEKDLDFLVGKKSIFHSLRLLDFAIDIAKNHKITNFTVSNLYWSEIERSHDWPELKSKFKKIYNKKKSELRTLCPKN